MFTYNKKNETYEFETEKLKGVFQPGGGVQRYPEPGPQGRGDRVGRGLRFRVSQL